MGVIYKITNNINGKIYIGQTNDYKRRMREHFNLNRPKYALQYAIQKYGKDNFTSEIIEQCDSSLLDERECYWINYYNSYIKNNGYNETFGGDNANALLKWQKANPDKVYQNALDGIKYAKQWHKDNPEQSAQQLYEAQKKAKISNQKAVRCVELNLIFNSLTDAEKWSVSSENPNGKKSTHQHISKVCKGQRKTTGGYHWEYI